MAQAKASGKPVEVTAKTDPWTKVVANPATGQFDAEFSAMVARVSDGKGGWRAPDSSLVVGADGQLHAVASRVPVTVSAGGTTPLVSVDDTPSTGLGFEWPATLPAPKVEGDTATYAEVYPGVDLTVKVSSDLVSTFLVVKDATAGANPVLQKIPLRVKTKGVTASPGKSGDVSYVASTGRTAFTLTTPTMWDSQGKTQPSTASAKARVVQAGTARVRPVSMAVSGNDVVIGADRAMLTDPTTVYPVVIDPDFTVGASSAVRITNNWVHVNYPGDDARVGYSGNWDPANGSYQSEMYYTFNMAGMHAASITKATFNHLNVHSVQSSPCGSASYGHPIEVGVTGAIPSSPSWSNRPAWWGAPVANGYAVGNQNACHLAEWESWELTGNIKQNSPAMSFGVVTIGMRGESSTDQYNWRHYDNDYGPVLAVSYSLPTPTVSVVNPILWDNQVTYYTATDQPTFKASYTGYGCTTCATSVFTVKDAAATTLWTGNVSSWSASFVASASMAGSAKHLLEGHPYTLTVSTSDGSVSTTSAAVTIYFMPTRAASMLLPGSSGGLQWLNQGSAVKTPIAVTGVAQLSLKVTLPPLADPQAAGCPVGKPPCLLARVSVAGLSGVPQFVNSQVAAPGTTVTVPLPDAPSGVGLVATVVIRNVYTGIESLPTSVPYRGAQTVPPKPTSVTSDYGLAPDVYRIDVVGPADPTITAFCWTLTAAQGPTQFDTATCRQVTIAADGTRVAALTGSALDALEPLTYVYVWSLNAVTGEPSSTFVAVTLPF